jgi:hypothetical protein
LAKKKSRKHDHKGVGKEGVMAPGSFGFRMINGLRFRMYDIHIHKRDAVAQAKRIREDENKRSKVQRARLAKVDRKGKSKDRWAVFEGPDYSYRPRGSKRKRRK